MKKVFQMGSAFIGIIVGAGFASGQEVLLYFTSFGHLGTVAAILATMLFAYLGMTLTRLGSRLRTTSHKDVIYKISGHYFGFLVDYTIIITLFGVGVVMIAGAGSIVNQQFGLEPVVGSVGMTVLVVVTVMMNVQKVVAVIGSITPFLILTVILVAAYCLATMDTTFAVLDPIAKAQDSAVPNWFLSAVNYVSFNIAVGAAMTLVVGGAEKDEKIAALGGLVGGLGLGFLILLSHLAIFSKVDVVAGFDMPMLKLINDISPILAIFFSFVLFGMVFNTAVSMFYAFTARFMKLNTKKFNGFVVVSGVVAFFLSFAGFTKLVTFFYPLIGYLGLFLVVALIVASFRLPKKVRR